MTKLAWLLLAVVGFAILATANSGGYRYGVSDQAFYVPAIALRADPALFTSGRAWLEPQMRLWMGDEIFGALARLTGTGLPTQFAALYLLTMATLASGAIVLARRLGCSWWTVATFLLLLTLKHRIAKTGANSLEGYFHPRMLAFAIGVFALAAIPSRRFRHALAFVLLAALIHTTTAGWFAAVLVASWLFALAQQKGMAWHSSLGGLLVVSAVAALALTFVRAISPIMDAPWLAVLGDKDYLFPLAWPGYAWLTNLLAPTVIVLTYRARQKRGMAAPGEDLLVMGLLALVIVFMTSLLPIERHVALAVQVQSNRVFWLLDFVAVLALSWWLAEGVGALGRPIARGALVALLLAAALGRGVYILQVEARRPLVSWELPESDWSEAMRWLRTGPSSWHVLADPGHAYKYGSSVRVAALRDTLVETGKDTALALYDRSVAVQVAERLQATADFDHLTLEDIRQLRQRFGVDVMVDRSTRSFPLQVLYQNRSFVIYDLR